MKKFAKIFCVTFILFSATLFITGCSCTSELDGMSGNLVDATSGTAQDALK